VPGDAHLDRLLAYEEIRQLVARYAVAVDSREDYNHLSHASSPKSKHSLVHPESGQSGVPYVLNPKPKLLRAFADRDGSMTDTGLDSEALLMQFNRLIQELLRGAMNRNTFRPGR
jgi:hypothetical protein